MKGGRNLVRGSAAKTFQRAREARLKQEGEEESEGSNDPFLPQEKTALTQSGLDPCTGIGISPGDFSATAASQEELDPGDSLLRTERNGRIYAADAIKKQLKESDHRGRGVVKSPWTQGT